MLTPGEGRAGIGGIHEAAQETEGAKLIAAFGALPEFAAVDSTMGSLRPVMRP